MSEQRRSQGEGEQSPWDASRKAFEAWRSGDAEAVDDLVRVMTPVLWHVVRAYGHDQSTAEDIVQSTWLGFVRRHEAITDPQAVASWLITSARREATHQAGRARRSVPVGEEELASRLPDAASAETLAVLDDEGARLWGAVAGLDARCQRLLRVVAFQDRPDYTSLTEELQMPVGSIGPTRARCLKKLRKALTTQGGVA